jgi:ABC-type transport system involved in multi-copper enzyme maturation permease subunit
MTYWPILDRELRVWARRGVTYWGRLAVAAGCILACAPLLLWSGPLVAPGTTGRRAFDSLVTAAFMLCCMACLLTTDAISSERREGTLGLLLLTRVKHLDLLLGKLASNGLAAVLGLVAFLPVLALPLLTGGVSGGEAVRRAVALLDTLFLALSIGLWASARGVERSRTAWRALLVLAGLLLGPALVGRLLPSTHLDVASPITAILQAADLTYKRSATGYWLSLCLVQMIGWGFLLWATVRLSRGVNETKEAGFGAKVTGPREDNVQTLSPAVVGDSLPLSSPAGISAVIKCSYCGRGNDVGTDFCRECGTELQPKRVVRSASWLLSSAATPLHWLLARQRGLKPLLWVAAFIGCLHLIILQLFGRFIGLGSYWFGIYPSFGLAGAAIEGGLFAWVASRFLVEARRTGELELLLTTPVGAETLIWAQWETLKQLARWPVVIMAGLHLIVEIPILLLAGPPSVLWKLYYALALLLNTVNIVLGVGALFWLAPWFGMRIAGQGRVVFWTVLVVKGCPFVMSLIWPLLYRLITTWAGTNAALRNVWSDSFWVFGFLVPPIATLLVYACLIRAARSQLVNLGGTATFDTCHLLSRSLQKIAGIIRRARSWRANGISSPS